MQTSDFLFELGTEELPPVALKKLSDAFLTGFKNRITAANLSFEHIHAYATPRRLAIKVTELGLSQPDKTETKLGPAVAAAFDADGNPTKAAEGFARSCGTTVSELAEYDTDKGTRLGFAVKTVGAPAQELLPEIIQQSLNALPIPKGMRWGSRSETFVRPVKWVVALIGSNVLPITMFGCQSSNISRGHRFMSDGDIVIDCPANYADILRTAHVVADQQERMETIQSQVEKLAAEQDLVAVIEPELLEEVSALVEWPVALVGTFETSFLSVPQEALISTMSKNQKYFHMTDSDGKLVEKFITISNLVSTNPDAIIAGNEKVIRPRLADAKFFYEQDCKHSLTHYARSLANIVFQNKLGTVADKCHRIGKIAGFIGNKIDANLDSVATASAICKADLVTDMVGEFPSLQGIMGKYYAAVEGLDEEVASSLYEIYLPKFSGDDLPQTKTGIALALADRVDTLVGIFGIEQLPSGNKDPFALRRAALGVINIILEHQLPLDLSELIKEALASYDGVNLTDQTEVTLLDFFNSRLRSMYLEQGISAQVFNSVEELKLTSVLDINKRVQAVNDFASKSEADSLSGSNKRVANILTKNADDASNAVFSEDLLREPAEQALFASYTTLKNDVISASYNSDYVQALSQLSELKDPLDTFFDDVMVMDKDETVKNNRLALLGLIRELFLSVADISCLQK